MIKVKLRTITIEVVLQIVSKVPRVIHRDGCELNQTSTRQPRRVSRALRQCIYDRKAQDPTRNERARRRARGDFLHTRSESTMRIQNKTYPSVMRDSKAGVEAANNIFTYSSRLLQMFSGIPPDTTQLQYNTTRRTGYIWHGPGRKLKKVVAFELFKSVDENINCSTTN